MPAALEVNKEAVKMLAKVIGVRAAAREMGLPEPTVQAWSAREDWLADTRVVPVSRPASMVPATRATKSPEEALSAVLADHERETKLSLARTARANALVAERAGLSGAGDALSTGKLAALVHGWADGSTGSPAVVINVALMCQPADSSPTAPVVDI